MQHQTTWPRGALFLRFDTEPAWAEVEREIEHKHDVVGAILNPQSRLIKEAAREAFEPLAGRPSRPMPLALLVTSGLAPFLALMIIATTGIRLFPVVLLIRWLGTFAFVTGLILIVRNRRADARARRPHGEQVTPLQ